MALSSSVDCTETWVAMTWKTITVTVIEYLIWKTHEESNGDKGHEMCRRKRRTEDHKILCSWIEYEEMKDYSQKHLNIVVFEISQLHDM